MGIYTYKIQENKHKLYAKEFSGKRNATTSTFQFKDNRLEAIKQNELKDIANNRPLSEKLIQLQKIANHYTSKASNPKPVQLKLNPIQSIYYKVLLRKANRLLGSHNGNTAEAPNELMEALTVLEYKSSHPTFGEGKFYNATEDLRKLKRALRNW